MDENDGDKSNALDGLTGLANGPAGRRQAGELEAAPMAEGLSEELMDLVVRYFCMGHSGCLKSLMEQFERNILEHVLAQTHWNQRKTADILGVKYTTLNHKVIKMGLQISEEDLRRWKLKDIVAEASRKKPKDRLLRA